ncbi:hypothetical protein AGR4A_Lc10021 [Agrobacterium tumefaciens str. B6]|uniref:Uncharacterized protein n=1 Tax=Agrobacterium tumefaciens str. B6 TaxID=1183423 RepID=A0A822V599_AGRTU|nr:hypothetical protein AGR4A_Lc10021 [Agrobacterium tumefaciens str. B6]
MVHSDVLFPNAVSGTGWHKKVRQEKPDYRAKNEPIDNWMR